MFRTDLLSVIRNLNTVFTAIGICHTGYVNCLLARSEFHPDLASITNTYCCEYSIKSSRDGQEVCPKHVEFVTKIYFRNNASRWLLL